ncbi:3-phosphoglycerate kinase [Stutzerimonas stutzeri]|uniref:3-phosphoglycerate kinase n=1 Tax=Stutzerimonas stutzeri TaxID=316 RepID=UPI000C4F96E3|nr:3-phosphoglycerate kinase [Stutzerimonas stutzeri]MBS67047.1 3-phosphoglycerate kinase [Pseudomonas sp.]|tara:strand:- start:666 stop:986 length:321 start_codon:yes stop_codon:yes gene_type:complete
MKTIGYLLVALLPLTANAVTYPVDIEQQLNGAEITVTPQTIDRDLAGLLLLNYGGTAAVCTAVFQNGPEAPRTRRTELQPGERKALTSKFKRDVIRLRIKLTCQPE